MTWYPFYDYYKEYMYIDCFNTLNNRGQGLFVIIAPQDCPTMRQTLCFRSNLQSWRVIKNTAAHAYRKTLRTGQVITAKNQFTLYSSSNYIEIFCRYAGIKADNLQHLCFDLHAVIIETITQSHPTLMMCLGESTI